MKKNQISTRGVKDFSKILLSTHDDIEKLFLYQAVPPALPIIVDLTEKDKYSESINAMRLILSHNRENSMLIEFKVKSLCNQGIDTLGNPNIDILPTFYIQCSTLYIVGYKEGDGLVIVKDDDSRYNPSTTQYNFYSVDTQNIQTVAYLVSETLRQPASLNQLHIANLIEGGNYILNIDVVATADKEILINQSDFFVTQAIINELEETTKLLSINKAAHKWKGETEFSPSGKELSTAKLNVLKKHNQIFLESMSFMLTNRLVKQLAESLDDFSEVANMMCSTKVK